MGNVAAFGFYIVDGELPYWFIVGLDVIISYDLFLQSVHSCKHGT